MNSRASVYVVTSGEYSDYRIEAVYEDRSLADQHAEITDCRVEEYAISIEPPHRTAVLHLSQDLRKALLKAGPPWTGIADPWEYVHVVAQPHAYEPCRVYENSFPQLTVVGTEFDRVRKVFSERRAKWLAEILDGREQ